MRPHEPARRFAGGRRKMKATKLICTAVLAMAPAFGLAANPTENCIDSLAADASLKVLADKIALARSSQAQLVRVSDRTATQEERVAIAAWMQKRNACFDAGVEQRRASMKPQEVAFVRSVFVFQQRLV